MRSRSLSVLLLVLGLLLGPFTASAVAELSSGQTVYTPIYSHIYSGDREHPLLLAATLSIRNTDPNHSITIVKVDYHDSDGKLLQHYLASPVTLSPAQSIRYVVKFSDKAGGSGANFYVTWKAHRPVNPPIIESIMIGTQNQLGISFVSRGQVVQ
jgi:hypothetical protein